MGFLSPWFLAGMAALSLPLWLHLLRRFQKTPRPFSSLMFFERRVQSSTRHRRLRYLALLALRLALLALLTLAFANPFINAEANKVERQTLTVIAIDRSFSMRQGDRLMQAKAEAKRLLAGVTGRRRVQLAAFDSHLEMLTQPEAGGAGLSAAVDAVAPGDDISSYGEVTRGLRALEQSSGLAIDAHVITDEQRTSLPGSSFGDLTLGPNIRLALHCVGSNAPNWAVESVNAPAHVFDAGAQRISGVIAGWNTVATTRRVALLLDGKTAAALTVNVPSSGRAEFSFDNVVVPHGAHHAQIQLDPGDSLPQDDVFPFALERSDPQRVLFASASGRANEAFFYKSAFEAARSSGFTVQTATQSQLKDQDLSRYAFVVLNNPGILSDDALQHLSKYVRGGGAAFLAAGPNTVREGTVPIATNAIVASGEQQSADRTGSANSVLTSGGDFENVAFLSAPRLTARPTDRVLARFANGSPLLLGSTTGEGRLLVFAGTLDNTTSDFPLHTSFLPFVAQTAAYLSGTESEPASVAVGTPVALRKSNTQNTAADVIGPDRAHLLSFDEATKAMSLTLNREGFYDIQRANRQRILVAAHADRRESDLTQAAPDVLKIWRNTGSTSPGPPASGKHETVQRPLWRYLLALAVLAALCESMFAMRYLSQEGPAG